MGETPYLTSCAELLLQLVADGAGCAVLSRNAVTRSAKPASYSLRAIRRPALRTQISMATRSQRAFTLTQQATQNLIRDTRAGTMGKA